MFVKIKRLAPIKINIAQIPIPKGPNGKIPNEIKILILIPPKNIAGFDISSSTVLNLSKSFDMTQLNDTIAETNANKAVGNAIVQVKVPTIHRAKSVIVVAKPSVQIMIFHHFLQHLSV